MSQPENNTNSMLYIVCIVGKADKIIGPYSANTALIKFSSRYIYLSKYALTTGRPTYSKEKWNRSSRKTFFSRLCTFGKADESLQETEAYRHITARVMYNMT